jgi:putative NADH-flavin reductase
VLPTGRTGGHLVELSLASGHHVTALVRQTRSLLPRSGLEVAHGDPRDRDTLARLLIGQDAVVSCLGQTSTHDAHLLRDSAAAVIDACKTSGVRRYLVVSQGLQYPAKNPVLLTLHWILAKYVADTAEMEALIAQSALDWTIVRPPRLLEGGRRRGFRVNVGAMPPGRRSM